MDFSHRVIESTFLILTSLLSPIARWVPRDLRNLTTAIATQKLLDCGSKSFLSPSLYICELETAPKTMSPWYKTALWTALFVFLFFLIHFNSVHCSMNYILEWLKLKRPFHLTRLFLSLIHALSEAVLGSVSSLIYPMVDRLCKCYEIAFTKLSCSSNLGFTLYPYDK